jgi:hypothetical protein
MTLEEARDSAIIMQAFNLLAKAGNQRMAKAATEAFDRFKERYARYKPFEPEYDGSRGYVKTQ